MAKHAGVHTVREDHHVDQPGIVSLRTLAVIALVAILVLSWIKPVQMNEDEEPVVAKKQPTTKLQIGVKKRIENCQRKSRRGDLLYIHYRGTLEDGGSEFDNSYKRGDPLKFTLGQGQVIKGWDIGLTGVCEGEKRKLVIPSELGYGSQGAPPSIPPDAVLIFEVEVVKIDDQDKNEL